MRDDTGGTPGTLGTPGASGTSGGSRGGASDGAPGRPARWSTGRQLLVALGLALGPAVALGFARFAYALLLPPMRSALGWSFATAGVMNTANAAGYLIGAVTAVSVPA